VNNLDEIEAEIPSESSDDEYIIETDDGIVKDTTSNSSVVWKYFKRVNYVSKKTKIKSPRVKCLHTQALIVLMKVMDFNGLHKETRKT
jgi:hypothetical protein